MFLVCMIWIKEVPPCTEMKTTSPDPVWATVWAYVGTRGGMNALLDRLARSVGCGFILRGPHRAPYRHVLLGCKNDKIHRNAIKARILAESIQRRVEHDRVNVRTIGKRVAIKSAILQQTQQNRLQSLAL